MHAVGIVVRAPRCVPFAWLYAPVWSVPSTTLGSQPTISMMSISPSSGHVPLSATIQIAGHMPRPHGSFARTS